MSLQSRLTALATAIGTDIKALTNSVQTKSTWYAGAGAPSAALGQQGDWYMEQMTGKIWHKNPAWGLASAAQVALTLDTIHLVGTAGQPAFGTNWLNYGSGFQPAGFRKDPFGNVRLFGSVKGGSTGTVIFQLPVGYRPVNTVRFNPRGSGQGNTAWGQINVTPDGNVAAYGDNPPSLISLDGVEFETESVSELQIGSVAKQELPAVVGALPSSPTEGQIVRLQTSAMAAAGISPMHLVYRGGQAGSSKWDCLGGGRLVGLQTVTNSQGTAGIGTYAAMNNGPTIVVPVTGVYDIRVSGAMYTDATSLVDARVALATDSTGRGIVAWHSNQGAYEGFGHEGEQHDVAINAGQTIHLMIATSNAICSFGNPIAWRIVATPVRVG